jgi:flagellar biosynthesis/type III secretory pathway ATPase
MQTFKDSITGNIWQFDDDVANIHAFPNTPATLQPYTLPSPTASQLLDAAQQTQLAIIDSAYNTAMQQPVAYMNTTFQADKDSQDLMNRAITGLQAIIATGGTVPANFAWYDINNQPVTMTLLQLQELFATGVANVNALFVHKQTQKAAIRAATTVSAVTKIVW